MLISLIILPVTICLVDKFYVRKSKERSGGDKVKKYEIDCYYRITICFLVGVIILMLLNIVMSAHGIFFLSKMYMNEPYLHTNQSSDRKMYIYIIPTNHYVLYFLEAAYEAAEENLILWGFLFLVNLLSKLSSQVFYFKTFTIVLVIRVLFVFICHFNIWELAMNKFTLEDNFHKFALAIYPFHTSPKTLRVAEILCSLIVFSAFAIYAKKLTSGRMQGMDGLSRSLLNHGNLKIEAERTAERKFVRKYLVGYTLFLVYHLVINLIECHFINLFYGLSMIEIPKELMYIEMGTSVLADVLAIIPPFLFLLLITLIACIGMKNIAGRQINEVITETEEIENTTESEDYCEENEEIEEEIGRIELKKRKRVEEKERFRIKRLLLTTLIIVFCSTFSASFIGYLRFTDGDNMQVSLHPGDYLVINTSRNTPFSEFLKSCKRYEITGSPTYQLDAFDFLEYLYPMNTYELDDTRILRYKTYEENNTPLHQEIDVPSDLMRMWFPANTCFRNISKSVNFTVVPYPYPCYHDFIDNQGTPNDGLRILCSKYDKISEEYMNCTKNDSNAREQCCLQKDSIISSEDISFSLTAVRPYYTGINPTTNHFLEEGSLIEFNRTIPYMGENSMTNEEKFYLTCHHDKWEVGVGIVVGILVIMGLYLTVGYLCLIKLFSRVFFYSLKKIC